MTASSKFNRESHVFFMKKKLKRLAKMLPSQMFICFNEKKMAHNFFFLFVKFIYSFNTFQYNAKLWNICAIVESIISYRMQLNKWKYQNKLRHYKNTRKNEMFVFWWSHNSNNHHSAKQKSCFNSFFICLIICQLPFSGASQWKSENVHLLDGFDGGYFPNAITIWWHDIEVC